MTDSVKLKMVLHTLLFLRKKFRYVRIYFSLLCLTILLSHSISGVALAAATQEPWAFMPMLTSLLMVLVVIVVIAVVLKKLNIGMQGTRGIKIISVVNLGSKERLMVVEVAGQQHLLGITAHQINHLFELPTPLGESLSPEMMETSIDNSHSALTIPGWLEKLKQSKRTE